MIDADLSQLRGAMNDAPAPGTAVLIAASDHLDATVALWVACGLTRPWNDSAADFRRAVDGASSDVLLATAGGRIVGSVMVGFDGHRGWVYYLAVSPDARRQGHGRTLMGAATAWLRARDVPKIQLMVRDGNHDAAAFYAALGLERVAVSVYGAFLDGTA